MTLQIARGYNQENEEAVFSSLPAPLLTGATGQIFGPQHGGRVISSADVDGLLNNPARWLYQTIHEAPLEMAEHRLSPATIGPLPMEFLVSMAVLAFNVKATSVLPVKAMGRIILVEYAPWQRSDPPVPLLSLLNLSPKAIAMHNAAIHLILTRQDASAIRPAMGLVLQSGSRSDMLVPEAFYFVTKMLSLATGAYSQDLYASK